MATWDQLREGYEIRKGGFFGEFQYARVHYFSKDLPNHDDVAGVTTRRVIDILDDPMLPAYGAFFDDPNLPLARVRWKRIIKGPTLNQATVEITYTSDSNYGAGYPVVYGTRRAEEVPLRVPCLRTVGTFETGFDYLRSEWLGWRTKGYRIRPKVLSTSDLSYYFDEIEAQVGKVFMLGGTPGRPEGIPYVFGAPQVVPTSAAGQIILTYVFWTLRPVKFFPAFALGTDQELPVESLGFLDEYPRSIGGALTRVPAVPFTDIYEFGDALPWL